MRTPPIDPSRAGALSTRDYTRLFERLPGRYVVLSLDLRIVAASDDYLQATLTRREDIVGRGLFEVFPENPADPHAGGERLVREHIDRLLTTGAPQVLPTLKYDIVNASGVYEERFWRVAFSAVSDPQAPPRWVVLHVEDVTSKVVGERESAAWIQDARTRLGQAVRELSDQTRRYEEAKRELTFHRAALSRAGILSETDVRGTITHVNDEFCRISGYAREELLGRNHRMINSGVHPRSFWTDMYAALVRDGIWQGAVCNRAKDGSLYWVQCTNVAFRDESDRLTRYISLRTDITDRVRAEEALRERDARLRFIADSMPQIVWTTTPDGAVDYLNRRWNESTGLDSERSMGWGWIQAIHPDDRERCAETWNRSVRTGTPFETEYRLRGREGDYRWHLVRGLPHLDNQGRIVQWVGTCTDISEVKEARKEAERARAVAEQASLAKSEFLARMSHVIRTPLNGVMGMTDLLLDTDLSPTQRHYASLVQTSARSLTTVINDILDFSKVEAGKLDIASDHFDPAALARSVADLMEPLATRKGLALTCALAPDLPESILGDEGRVRQILINLIGNAIKFTDTGRIDLLLSSHPSEPGCASLRFAVRDTGIGIPAVLQPTLFDPFVQVHRDRAAGGTGLGLPICRQLALAMGGTIGVESEEGRGSTFWFTITGGAADAAIRPADRPAVPGIPLVGEGRTVLIAEDNDVNQIVVSELLRRAGFRCDIVPDGLAAVESVRRGRYDLVLMDCQMPVLDGFAAAGEIRALETDGSRSGRARLPIIALTASAMKGDRERCFQAGMDGYVSKPIDPRALLSEIARVLADHPQAKGQAA